MMDGQWKRASFMTFAPLTPFSVSIDPRPYYCESTVSVPLTPAGLGPAPAAASSSQLLGGPNLLTGFMQPYQQSQQASYNYQQLQQQQQSYQLLLQQMLSGPPVTQSPNPFPGCL